MKLEKTYQPDKHEAKIYQLWEKSGAFQPKGNPKKQPFSIIMPPPNANGSLHTGHAMYTVEDILIRYHRMLDQPTLWLPGTDHAGIETQVVFEAELKKQGKSRFDFTPEEFYQAVLKYTQSNQHRIIDQLKSLGFSADWSRLKFTLDSDIVEIVYDTFEKLYKDKLIYRANRIVNWCTNCQASFADIEVKYRTQTDSLYTLDYGPLKIATTRPETIFADVAVAVNPTDPRYQKLIGKTATVPLIDRAVPIIADDHVDPKVGTGALKVTPGHDPADFEIGLRHNLPQITVIDFDGKMINVPELADRDVVRARIVTAGLLKKDGKLVKSSNIKHAVGVHDRCGTIIEPLVTEQWWLKVAPLVKPAIKAVESGDIKIVPGRFKKVYLDWLRNLRDWNISRQIWWGIPIPAYIADDGSVLVDWQSKTKQIKGHQHKIYHRTTDTFDTWFSSSQWPFATLMTTGDFKDFYPTSVMETGRDILFLWVSRMVMLGLYRTDRIPFKTIYLHGLVLDEHGQKMSKSRGNVIDPLEMTAKYGTDALRLALTIGITPGNDGALSNQKVEAFRNFANKLWNVSRFVLEKAENYSPTPPEATSLADQWILGRLNQTIKSTTKSLDNFRFSEAAQSVYSLLWDDFADWYVEASKVDPNLSVLVYGLETILKLAHPFVPFVTEAIWQNIPWQKQNLIVSEWPEVLKSVPSSAAKDFAIIQDLIGRIRNVAKDVGLSKPELLFTDNRPVEENLAIIQKLAKLKQATKVEKGRGLQLLESAWLDLTDQQLHDYHHRLQELLRVKSAYAKSLVSKVNNPGFKKNAPASVFQQESKRLAEVLADVKQLTAQIKKLN